MRSPSALGASIQAAIEGDARFEPYRAHIQYLCCYRTKSDHVFACERTTKNQITLWLPENDDVRRLAELHGLKIARSVPASTSTDGRYGRLSSLKSVPELRSAPLYRVQVTTAGQAIRVLEALC